MAVTGVHLDTVARRPLGADRRLHVAAHVLVDLGNGQLARNRARPFPGDRRRGY